MRVGPPRPRRDGVEGASSWAVRRGRQVPGAGCVRGDLAWLRLGWDTAADQADAEIALGEAFEKGLGARLEGAGMWASRGGAIALGRRDGETTIVFAPDKRLAGGPGRPVGVGTQPRVVWPYRPGGAGLEQAPNGEEHHQGSGGGRSGIGRPPLTGTHSRNATLFGPIPV